MKKAFPIALMVLGLVLVGAGIYTTSRGFQAKDDVKSELVAQNITTPEDASIPGVQVNNARTGQDVEGVQAGKEGLLDAVGGGPCQVSGDAVQRAAAGSTGNDPAHVRSPVDVFAWLVVLAAFKERLLFGVEVVVDGLRQNRVVRE